MVKWGLRELIEGWGQRNSVEVSYIGKVKSFFFFKQKTAYHFMPSLLGSDMFIRDRKILSNCAHQNALYCGKHFHSFPRGGGAM